MTALELRGVSKRYGRTTAVDDVTLSVADGELVALVGPSGCGKSTLLMLAAGLLEPDAGQVLVGDRVVAGGGTWVAPEDRRVGVVFQDAALFPHLRVAENIAFGVPRGRDRATRVRELLELVDLPDHGRRYPHELSGGQQQRVALARALAPRPSVVLFDEAFGNLDHGLRSSVRDATAAALRGTGAAGVFVTHDQSEALAVGERVCVMREGRFEHVGEPADAFHRPATRSARPTSSPAGRPVRSCRRRWARSRRPPRRPVTSRSCCGPTRWSSPPTRPAPPASCTASSAAPRTCTRSACRRVRSCARWCPTPSTSPPAHG